MHSSLNLCNYNTISTSVHRKRELHHAAMDFIVMIASYLVWFVEYAQPATPIPPLHCMSDMLFEVESHLFWKTNHNSLRYLINHIVGNFCTSLVQNELWGVYLKREVSLLLVRDKLRQIVLQYTDFRLKSYDLLLSVLECLLFGCKNLFEVRLIGTE